jgi:hypothetical protein
MTEKHESKSVNSEIKRDIPHLGKPLGSQNKIT